MIKLLQRIGNSKAVILTAEQLDHLGASEAVEIKYAEGSLIISAAPEDKIPARRKRALRQSLDSLHEKFPETLERLAE